MIEQIVALAIALGHIQTEKQTPLMELCALAQDQLRMRLRNGISPDDCKNAFCMGAACLALAQLYTGYQTQSFSAGNLTIKQADGKSISTQWRQQCDQIMAPFLNDTQFSFQGVSG